MLLILYDIDLNIGNISLYGKFHGQHNENNQLFNPIELGHCGTGDLVPTVHVSPDGMPTGYRAKSNLKILIQRKLTQSVELLADFW